MATVKQYGYYIKGGKLSIVQKDTSFDNDVNSKDYGPGSDKIQYKSPLEAVTDGIEISYCYTPNFTFNDFSETKSGTQYEEDGGFLKITAASHGMSVGNYIYVRGSERINGLHKITAEDTNTMTLSTKYSGAGATESFLVHIDIDVLNDEDDFIPINSYLQKALVWYVKARFLEDARDIEGHEYYMRKFKKMLEKHENSRVAGPRIMASNSHLT